MINNKGHNPFDSTHTKPFEDKKIPAEMMRLHSSCEAFIKIYIKNKAKVCPHELL